jgi:hypothetical protein
MSKISSVRLLRERALDPLDMPSTTDKRASASRPARSVTVNLAESPLGWLLSRGLISQLQFDAGERLRADWERSQLPPKVTMSWDAAPITRGRGGASAGADLSASQLDARNRFDAAVASAGPGLSDILWRVVCAGEGMRDAETALGWPARAGKLVLGLALDRLALYYRMG